MTSFKNFAKLFAVSLLLTLFYGGRAQNDPPSQSVTVMVGDDVVLPCQLQPAINAVSMTIEWGRPDLDPRFVFVWHDGKELAVDQNEAYKKRASLSVDKLRRGDLSLTLPKVQISDNGIYRCYIPKQSKEYFVELLVGAASSPGISLAGFSKNSGGVMLDCESNGWYPQPDVLVMDGDGKVFSAGHTEAVRDPSGLYMVKRRVTVEKRNSNNFTCRIHQENINKTEETHIYVPDDFFTVLSSCSDCSTSTAFSVLFGLMLIAAVVLFVWIWRKHKNVHFLLCGGTGDKQPETTEPLLAERKKTEDLRNENKKLKEEAEKNRTQVIGILKELIEEQGKQRNQMNSQFEEAEKLAEETEEKMEKVDKEIKEKGGDKTANKAEGYLKLKEILQEVGWKQEERKREQQQLEMTTQSLLKKTMDEFLRLGGPGRVEVSTGQEENK